MAARNSNRTRSHCVICGLFVSYQASIPKQWQSEYRAIRLPQGGDQIPFLTGVGHFGSEQRLSAPSNPNQRYDDHDYQESPLDTIPLYEGLERHPLPYFLIHNACWELLKVLVHPEEVSISRLYRICHSFSLRRNSQLLWGHTYGALLMPHALPFPRWMEESSRESPAPAEQYSYYHSYCHENPLDIPFLKYTPIKPEAMIMPQEADIVSEAPKDQYDCFRCLPTELRDAILHILQSEDVINLRLASRSFASIPLSQGFWRSRFYYSFERNHIFEAFNEAHGSQDWRAWYNSTKIPPQERTEWRRRYGSTMLNHAVAIKNRKRIWNCSRPLAELLTLHPLETHELHKMAEHNHVAWRMAGLGPVERFFTNVFNRRAFQEDAVRVPAKISHISISLVTFNEARYVSGFRIRSAEGQEIILGYVYPGNEVLLDIGEKDGEAPSLTGFIVAVDETGIKAIRAVMEGGHMSQWAGDHKGFPRTTKLCMNERITHLKGGFDGFKMFSLSVPEEERISHEMPNLPLRKSGLWYPDIPAERETIQEYIHLGAESPTSHFRPFSHANFGGHKGVLLKHIKKITVATRGIWLCSIKFHYDADLESVNCKGSKQHHDPTFQEVESKMSYEIDGPGGERIIGIHVRDASSMEEEGRIFGITGLQVRNETKIFTHSLAFSHGQGSNLHKSPDLQIFTNKGRSTIFEPNVIPFIKLPFSSHQAPKFKRMDADAGTTMTGFYTQYEYGAGLMSVGVMVGIGMITEKSSELDDI